MEQSSAFDLFQVQLQLTDNGMDHINEIVDCVYNYIDMLHYQNSHWQELFNERKRTLLLAYNYQEKQKPIEYAPDLAQRLQWTHITHILNNPQQLLYSHQVLAGL